MTIIEFGSLAGAMIAVITLITKIVSLITSIQSLINRLDTMQRDIEFTKISFQNVSDRMNRVETRLESIEEDSDDFRQLIKEQQYAFK